MDTIPSVPMKIKLKRDNKEKEALETILLKKKIKEKEIIKKKLKKIRADFYIDEHKKKNQILLKEKKKARFQKKFFVPSESKIFFVIRIRGINGLPPQTKKILQLLRLGQINNGIFLKINSSTVQMLKKIEPFVAYGYPSSEMVKSLVKKKGFGKIGKRGAWQKISLDNNQIIEQTLSRYGVFSLEDLIHEINLCGPYFKEINNFLWPFKLRSPRKGFSKLGKTRSFSEKGSYGNWENSINHLIKKMI
mmetsp:Transcript_67061/g.159978  ORF Transcript_67061/g.159978 Transcript_67061/m.159978 type:complete len:248 (-) Transcript_67061:758-1501(-)